MRKLFLCALILAALLGAQTKNSRLSQPRRFAGIVVDAEGKAIPAVRIDNSGGDRRALRQTDDQGRFEINTDAPAMVLRKEGYNSAFVQNDGSDVRVILKHSIAKEFPDCSSTAHLDSMDGWGASFAFLKTKGITAGTQGSDSDYGARSYSVGKGKKARTIRHGSGPMWGYDLPYDELVWRSVQHDETIFVKAKITITVGYGQLSNGNRWRYLSKFGESAKYTDVEPATADILDKFMDGACWKPQSPK